MIAADVSDQIRRHGVGQNSQHTPHGQNGFYLSVLSVYIGVLSIYPFLTSTDEVTNLIIWTAAEISSLIMAASMPFIRLFVKSKLSTLKSYSSGAQGLNEQPQDTSFTPSIPTTVGFSRPGWRAHSRDSDLLAETPPEMAGDNGTLGPYP